jgi:hypothetical protein
VGWIPSACKDIINPALTWQNLVKVIPWGIADTQWKVRMCMVPMRIHIHPDAIVAGIPELERTNGDATAIHKSLFSKL